MPAIVKVKVIEGRDLPIMDRASDLTDAFVELRLGNTTFKTEVCRKSLNPQWNSEWFRFEIDDEELQEETLQIKVLDYDHYSSHDPIGKVNINLDTNIIQNGTKELNGLFPIYDTIHGVRGYIKLKVRIQFFIDANKYRQTSCGIKFFSSMGVPYGFVASRFQGFVDELLVDDDPEYQWIDKIRTPRATNEARQRHFAKLSGEVKRKIGLKVIELGGNAIIGYQQQFDLEGETGMVVRGIGTAVHLVADDENQNISFTVPQSPEQPNPPEMTWNQSCRLSQAYQQLFFNNPLSCDVEHNEKCHMENADNKSIHKLKKVYTDDLEYPFFTITNPPSFFVLHIGGIVSARSVKLLDKINNPDEPETRDSWWNELRVEIKSHTRAMGCSAVIGYTEYATICEELMVLSAYGTACVISPHVFEVHDDSMKKEGICDDEESEHNKSGEGGKNSASYKQRMDRLSVNSSENNQNPVGAYYMNSLPSCHQCHVPYTDSDLSLPVSLVRCMFCRQDKVPDILFATMEIPDELPVNGTGCLIQARVIRVRKKEKGEADAENVSQILPFLEFDLNQQLVNKLKIKGMNAIFGLKTRLSIGEQTIIAVVTGTCVYLAALPPPPVIVLTSRRSSNGKEDDDSYTDMQKRLMDITKKNKEFFNLKDARELQCKYTEETDTLKEKPGKLDLLVDGKESFVFKLDDKSDACIQPLLNERNYEGFHVFNTQSTPGISLLKNECQFFSIFQHLRIPPNTDDDSKIAQWLSSVCDNCLLSLHLKTRSSQPCCVIGVSFEISLADDDYLQLTVNCLAASINEQFHGKTPRKPASRKSSGEFEHIFSKDKVSHQKPLSFRRKKNSSSSQQHTFNQTVLFCPLDCPPNGTIKSYHGNINVFLIRESTDLKEEGGVNLFMQQFIAEVHAIIRAHVVALGGNAILSFCLNEILLFYNSQKNQAQCLINVCGDVVNLKTSNDQMISLTCDVSSHPHSKTSSMQSTPNTPDSSNMLDSMKLDRAVFGTCV